MVNHTDHGVEVAAITAGQQALNQFLAALITMAFALIGGMLTGKGIIKQWKKNKRAVVVQLMSACVSL